MNKLFLVITLLLTNSLSADKASDLAIRTYAFFDTQNDTPNIEEVVKYIHGLREEIIELGYQVPSIEDMIAQIEKQAPEHGIVKNLTHTFNLGDNGYFSGFEVYACGKSIGEEFDWGNAAVGGCFILAGSLLMIIPGPSRWTAAYLIQSGADRVIDDVVAIGKQNGKGNWENLKGLVYD